MGEAQYLLEQRMRAKAAIRSVLADVKRDAVKASDPRTWAKIHPWATLAAALAAGFIAGEAIPLPGSAARKNDGYTERSHRHEKEPRREKRRGTFQAIISLAERLVSLARPIIAAILAAEAGHPPPHDQSNGRHHDMHSEMGPGPTL